jgi:hypothetical protein
MNVTKGMAERFIISLAGRRDESFMINSSESLWTYFK